MKCNNGRCPKCETKFLYWTKGVSITCVFCQEVIEVEPCEEE